jgi:membrane protein
VATERILKRVDDWAQKQSARVAGVNPWVVAVRTVRSSQADRVTGLAAEMAFFALLSLLPAVVALGAGLSLLERVLDPEAVAAGRAAAVDALGAIFTPQVRADVIEPLVDGLLEGERGGLALSGIVVALYLASRVFTATIRALDAAYNVEERRGAFRQRVMAVGFALGAVVVVALTLILAVVGPLFGTGQEIAGAFGLGGAFAALWQLMRWPVLLLIGVGFFAAVYRFGPNVDNRWRDCLPGAVLGMGLWLAVSAGFRLYLGTVGAPGAQFAPTDEAVALLGQVVGAVVAAVLWTFLSSISLLVGGELNSEVAAARGKVGSGRGGRRGRGGRGPGRPADRGVLP